MSTNTDGKEQRYITCGNLRITTISETWAGKPGIRIQALSADGNKVFPGSEIPIPDLKSAANLVGGVARAAWRAWKKGR
jgi:hypothetical protein